MNSEAFSVPRRQSVIGIALIFLTTVYKFLRGFWVLGAYLILKTPTGITLFYVILGTVILVVVVLAYSILYYRNFLFHIDYRNEEFILQKGVISTQNIAIPFDKIQQVYFKRSILERIINTYRVVIDTAGSNQEEVSITAINKEDADLLAGILTRVKKDVQQKEEEIEEKQSSAITYWQHKLSASTLFKIGISTNYLRGLGLVIAFFATIYNEFYRFLEDSYGDEVGEYYEMVPDATTSIGLFVALFVFLLIVSIIITVLEVFIKYFGLTLTQTSESLELEMGLKTNTRVALQPRRVQLMHTTTNPVQKYFNLYEAKIALASSENAMAKKNIKIPGLGSAELVKVKSFLYGENNPDLNAQFKSHGLILFRRFFISLIPVIISYAIFLYQPFMRQDLYFILTAVYLLLAMLYQFLRYRSLKLIFTNEFLNKYYGVWNKNEEQVEIFKMQALTIRQPLWYKNRGLFNLQFHTAGGDVTFKAVNNRIFPWLNYILFKVESSRKRWM